MKDSALPLYATTPASAFRPPILCRVPSGQRCIAHLVTRQHVSLASSWRRRMYSAAALSMRCGVVVLNTKHEKLSTHLH